jgi:hypothetical protein
MWSDSGGRKIDNGIELYIQMVTSLSFPDSISKVFMILRDFPASFMSTRRFMYFSSAI